MVAQTRRLVLRERDEACSSVDDEVDAAPVDLATDLEIAVLVPGNDDAAWTVRSRRLDGRLLVVLDVSRLLALAGEG